jgi:flavin-dependent dehydrogenase
MFVLRGADGLALPDFDVLIAGAGPAGCAATISLADFAPKLGTCVIDPGVDDSIRIGETVPPAIKPILDHLGLWSGFAADGHSASYRTFSAWSAPPLVSNEFLFQTQQVGWRLDRIRFDTMMARKAAARAAGWLRGRLAQLDLIDGVWRVRLGDGAAFTTRAVIDATGRAAAPARLCGLRPVRPDRLIGAFMHFDDPRANDCELMVEAVRDGWWYTAALPSGRRVIAFMTDADLARHRGIGQPEQWMNALDATAHIGAIASRARPLGQIRLQAAGSQIMSGDATQTLLCVGDASSCFDPVSGQGIVKALRSAIFASYAVADWLERRDGRGLARYRTFVASEFATYRRTLHDYYLLEQRWSANAFWQRRHTPPVSVRDRSAALPPAVSARL